MLSLLPSLELEGTQIHPVEREVDCNALDVAPDPESLLISDQNIEEVRQALRMRILIATEYVLLFYCYWPSHLRCGISRHWLYNAQKRHVVVKLREATTRLSVFDQPLTMGPTVPDENSNSVVANPWIRRVLSTSSFYTFSGGATLTSIETVLTQLAQMGRPPYQSGRGYVHLKSSSFHNH